MRTFTVTATGTAPLNYQWQNSSGLISGATTSNLTLTNVQPANADNYSVVITNIAGSIISSNAALTVNVPPAITNQPQSQFVAAGSNVTFTVTATGTAPLSYQWLLNGTNISDATNNAYLRTNVQPVDGGTYLVTVANAAGSVTSTPAMLVVNTSPSLTAIANFTIHAQTTLSFHRDGHRLRHPDQYSDLLARFDLSAGASIDPASGAFTWTPLDTQIGANNFTVTVTDNGIPPLSDSQSFVVTVVSRPQITNVTRAANGDVTLNWTAVPGQNYRVQHKLNLNDTNWIAVPGDVTASSTSASQTDTPGTDTQRFYRIAVLP